MRKYYLAGMVVFALFWADIVAAQGSRLKTFQAVEKAKATFAISSDLIPETKDFDVALLNAAIKLKNRDQLLVDLCNRADSLNLTLRFYYGRRHLNLIWSGVDNEIMHSLEVEIVFDENLKPKSVVSAITTQGKVNPTRQQVNEPTRQP